MNAELNMCPVWGVGQNSKLNVGECVHIGSVQFHGCLNTELDITFFEYIQKMILHHTAATAGTHFNGMTAAASSMADKWPF